jgi:hypothetical protein
MYQIQVNTLPVAHIKSPVHLAEYNITELITFDASRSYDVDVDAGNLKFEWKEGNTTLSTDMIFENYRFETLGWHTIDLYVGDSGHKGDDRAVATVSVHIINYIPGKDNDTDLDGMDDFWEWENQLDYRDGSDRDEDPDSDGYTNIQEYLGEDGVGAWRGQQDATDPWKSTSKPPPMLDLNAKAPVNEEPFAIWVFIIVVIAAIIIAALIVVIGYLRIHREEESDKREEAEEEAMLATPQLDIPTMPQGMPMVDASIPTLPQAEGGYDQSTALPPAQPMDAQPADAPMPMDANPIYQDAAQEQQNPLYDSQQ